MIKRYIGVSLITAAMLLAGCSSSDDDNPATTDGTVTDGTTTDGTVTDGTTTDGTATDGTTTDGAATDGTTTDGTATDGTTTDGTATDGTTTDGTVTDGGTTDGNFTGAGDGVVGGTVENNTAVTGRDDALVRVVHASRNAGTVVIVADEANALPLGSDPLDSASALSNASPVAGPFAVDAGVHTVQIIKGGDFFAGNFAVPALTIDSLTAGAGSSSTVVARGDALAATPTLEVVTLVNNFAPVDGTLGAVRVVHAADGMAIVFGGLVSGELDLFVNTDGATNGTPTVSGFGYADISTGYLELAPGTYQVVATEAGNSGNTRITATVEVTAGSVQTVIVRDLAGGTLGVDADLVVVDDTATP